MFKSIKDTNLSTDFPAKVNNMFVKIKIAVKSNTKEIAAVLLFRFQLITHFDLEVERRPAGSQTKTLELFRVSLE